MTARKRLCQNIFTYL